MDDPLLRVFLRQVEEQAGFADVAYRSAMTALDEIQQGTSSNQPHETFWFNVQAFVIAAANVSKLLGSKHGVFGLDRADLRAVVGVADDSLLADILVRHSFEHFDERLEVALAKVGGMTADRIIGLYTIEDMNNEAYFRVYQPETGDLSFWGDRLNLHDVAEALREVHTASRAETARRDRYG